MLELIRKNITAYALLHSKHRFWFEVLVWFATDEEWETLKEGLEQITLKRRLTQKGKRNDKCK